MRRVAKFLRCLAASDLARNKRVLNNAHDLRLRTAISPRGILGLTASQQPKRKRVCLFVNAGVLNQRMIHVPKDQYSSQSKPAFPGGPLPGSACQRLTSSRGEP